MTKTTAKLTLLLMPLIFAACSAHPPASTGAAPERGASQPAQIAMDEIEPAEGDDAQARALARALDERLAGGSLAGIFIEAECFDRDHFRAVEVHGDGFAVWDGESEFRLGGDEIRALLAAFEKIDFTGLEELYGGDDSAIRITCRVVLDIDGVRKQVAQSARGEQSEALKKLAAEIFDACREPALAGVRVASLADGLDKIARGEISPRALDVMAHRKPERSTPVSGGPAGWLFRLHDSRATTRLYEGGRLGEPVTLELGDLQVVELAGFLAAQKVVDLPQNLYADQYTDLIVRVFKYEARVQARQFAGMTATTHGAQQESFDTVFATIRELEERTEREGAAEGP